MRPIDNTVKNRLLQMHQTLYNNANPSMQIEAIRPRTAIFHKRFWQEATITAGATAQSTSVAVQRTEDGDNKVYAAYVSSGVLTVKVADLVFPVSNMNWTTVLTVSGAVSVCLEFDGKFVKSSLYKSEFYTNELPWVFYTTSTGELKGAILGSDFEVIVGANVSSFDAIRGVSSKYGDVDQGLLIFYIINGTVNYREYLNNEWGDQQTVSIAPANAVKIRAERVFDWRIVLQVQDYSGALYEVFSEPYYSGWVGVEYLTAKVTDMTVDVIEINYADYKNTDEYITASADMEVWAKSISSPYMVSAWNIPTSLYDEETEEYYDDYGYYVVLKWSDPVFNLDDNLAQFVMTDSYSATWYPQEIIRDELHNRLILRFTDFNNAGNPITLSYTPGTLSSGIVPVDADSIQFNATGLVPTFVPAPEFVSAWNTDSQTIFVLFDRPIIDILAQTGFNVYAQEPLMVSGDTEQLSYVVDSIEIPSTYKQADVSFESDVLTLNAGEIVNVLTGNTGSSAPSSTTVDIPTGVVQDDLLIIAISKDGTGTFGTPSGWTLLGQNYYSANALGIFYKVSDGTETSVTFTHASEPTSWISFIARGFNTPALSPYAYGNSNSPNAPSFTSASSSMWDSVWLAIAGWDYNRTTTAFPANMPDNQYATQNTTTGGCGIAMASKSTTDDTVDPDAFTINLSDTWVAFTMVLHPTATGGMTDTFISSPVLADRFDENSRLFWNETAPTGSSVVVEYGFSSSNEVAPSTWTAISNGNALDLSGVLATDYLYVKVTLTATTAVPSVSNFMVNDNNESGRIKINLTYDGRMKYPQGDVSIAFTGSMSGAGGSMVAPFTESFTPTGIVPFFNPNDAEYITAKVSDMTVNCFDVVYSSAQNGDEYLTASVSGMTIVVTKVGSLPL